VKKEKRKKEIKLRKNFFPTLLATLFLWLLTASLVYFTDPTSFGLVPLFFLLIFLCLIFTFSIILANTRRGAILSGILVIFLFLRYLGVGNILNFLLLTGIGIAAELYFARK
jgi:hypothetical protein